MKLRLPARISHKISDEDETDCSGSSKGCMKYGLAIFLFLFVSLFYSLYLFSIGFLSDDYIFLTLADQSLPFKRFDSLHYSLFINTLFWLTAKGVATIFWFHILAIFFHAINTCLLYVFLKNCFFEPIIKALTISLIFAVAPVNIEALAWCCSLPYVPLLTMLLLSLIVYFNPKDYLEFTRKKLMILCSIQLVSYIIWDWAIVIAPTLVLMELVRFNFKLRNKRKLSILLAVCLSYPLINNVVGFSLGYQINSPIAFLKNLFVAPMAGLFPEFQKSFYSSPLGIFCALFVLFVIAFIARLDKKSCMLLALFAVCQLPQAIFGMPQARYFYLSSFCLFYFLYAFFERFNLKALTHSAFALIFMFYIYSSDARLYDWQRSSFFAKDVKKMLEDKASCEKGALVIANLPYFYGLKDQIWKPRFWACGSECFTVPFVQIETEDSCTIGPKIYPIYKREDVGKAFSDHAVYEVVLNKDNGSYTLVKLF